MALGKLGSLFFDLSADTATLETDMGRAARIAEQRSREIQTQATAIGVAIGQNLIRAQDAVIGAVKRSFEEFDKLNKAVQRVGVSAEAFTGLAYAAKLADVPTEALTGSMEKLSKASVAARNGSSEQAAAFRALGISVTDNSGRLKDNGALLLEIADRFGGAADGADKTAIALALFGKSGGEMIPLLNGGADGIKQLTDEAAQFHQVMSKEVLQSAEDFNDNMTRLHMSVDGAMKVIAAQALPTLKDLTEIFVDNAKSASDLDGVTRSLEAGVKLLITSGVIVKDVFQDVGTIIGGAAGALVDIAHGRFAEAAAGMGASVDDVRAQITDDMETIARVWHAGADGIAEAAKKAGDAQQTALHYDPQSGARAKAGLDEQRKAIEALGKELSKLHEQTIGEGNKARGITESAADVMAYRVSVGDLAATIAQAGTQGMQLADQLIHQAQAYDTAKAAAERYAQQQSEAAALQRQIAQQAEAITRRDAMADLRRAGAQRSGPLGIFGPNPQDIRAAARAALLAEQQRYDDQLQQLDRFHREHALRDDEFNRAKLDAAKLNAALVKQIAETEADSQQRVAEQNFGTMLSFQENFFAGMASQSKGWFEVEKQISVIRTIINTAEAAMAAYKWAASWGGPPAGAAAAGITAAMGAVQVAMIEGQQYPGRRYGGPVSAASMYEVAEDGPELLRYGSKTMLMMGKQPGYVIPAQAAAAAGGGAQVVVNNHGEPMEARIRSVMGNVVTVDMVPSIVASAADAGHQRTVRALGDASSSASKSLARSTGIQPRGYRY